MFELQRARQVQARTAEVRPESVPARRPRRGTLRPKCMASVAAFTTLAVVMLAAPACTTLPIVTIPPPASGDARTVKVVPTTVRKVCQIIGEADFERGGVTINQTASRFGLYGTDLGIPVEYGGALRFLFGDSVPFLNNTGRTWQEDAYAYTTDTNPDDCLTLDLAKAPDGWFDFVTIPGVRLEGLEVPTGAFAANGFLFGFFTTDSVVDAGTMGRSVLAVSELGTSRFRKVLDFSNDKFINVSPVAVHNGDVQGLPSTTGDGVLLFGSGAWRHAPVSLAWAPIERIGDRSSYRFFAGTDGGGNPTWSPNESAGQPVFDQPCIGELSVNYVPQLSRWVMLDNCDTPRGIHVTSAPLPWGAWAPHQTVFDPWTDGGYCHFMHAVQDPPCDHVNDPSREATWGGEYGAYLIPRFTRVEPGGDVTVFFTMSVWNPYTVELMSARLRLG